MSILKKPIISLFIIVFFSLNSQATDLLHKIGVGYQNTKLPALSTRYYFQPTLSVTISSGFTTQQDHTQFLLEGKIQKVLFMEKYLHFFIGAGLGLINENIKGNNLSIPNVKNNGFKIEGTMGVEFFLVNLPSLGFLLETGLSLQSKSGNIQVNTLAHIPFKAGVYFYF
ncbi:MAG: hypothetical protein HAW63_02055 [Bdellovibrionaceae bacterium]|nr:hypothetical protein [Pseudobdellovibrionaceae bacterium]